MSKSVADNSQHSELPALLQLLQSGGFIMAKGGNTTYIACDATDNKPVETLIKLSSFYPNSDKVILVDNISRIQAYTNDLPDIAWDLFELSEKPLFLIPDNLKNIADKLIQLTNNIAFGLANETLVKNLCSRFRKPLFCIFLHNENINNDLLPENTQVFKVSSTSVVPSKIKLSKGNQIEILRS